MLKTRLMNYVNSEQREKLFLKTQTIRTCYQVIRISFWAFF